MSEHTPGPWEVDYGYADCLVICDTRGELIEIAAISLDEHGAEPTPEQKANAHLIAAAPDLLAVCQALYSIVLNGMTEDYDYMTACLGNARTVIARATGKGEK